MFDSDSAATPEPIPAGLDEMKPGPVLGALLSSIDVRSLSGHDRVVVLRAMQRMASHYQALTLDSMASISEHFTDIADEEVAHDAAAAEIRVALRLTRRASDADLAFATDLRERLPAVWAALASGDIDVRRARTIAGGTEHLSDAAAAEVVGRVINAAPGLTTGQLAARVRRLCIETAPNEAKRRYRFAVEGRRVVAEQMPAGTCNLFGFDLPPHQVAAATRRINRLARELRRDGEERTMDQLRADVFIDLLLGESTQGTGAVVDIHVDLATLADLTEQPGELAGYGPVVADIARQVAGMQERAEWRFTVTDPAGGWPMLTGTTRRRPDAGQRRTVQSRDRSCIFPGCRMPALQSDLDHTTPWAESRQTSVEDLAPCCRHDHVRVRHGAGWTYAPRDGGDYIWTSPLGHRYTTSGTPP